MNQMGLNPLLALYSSIGVQIIVETINLVNWTYFGSGYVSLPILAASSGKVTCRVVVGT